MILLLAEKQQIFFFKFLWLTWLRIKPRYPTLILMKELFLDFCKTHLSTFVLKIKISKIHSFFYLSHFSNLVNELVCTAFKVNVRNELNFINDQIWTVLLIHITLYSAASLFNNSFWDVRLSNCDVNSINCKKKKRIQKLTLTLILFHIYTQMLPVK